MAGDGTVHAVMDHDHDGAASDCGGAALPMKAAMGAPCASVCALVAALPARLGAPVSHGRVVHAPAIAESRAGRITAPDPFPPQARRPAVWSYDTGEKAMMALPTTALPKKPGPADMARRWLGGRRILILAAVSMAAGGAWLGWPWLAAAGSGRIDH
jgi:hypothetical protein